MGESKVKIGDKIFLYGQFLQNIYDFDEYSYNSIMGVMTTGGYYVTLKETDEIGASVPGFVVDFGTHPQFNDVRTAKSQMELADVTERLSLSQPLPFGNKVWTITSGRLFDEPAHHQ